MEKLHGKIEHQSEKYLKLQKNCIHQKFIIVNYHNNLASNI